MPSKTHSSAMNKTYLRFLVVCVLIVALQVWLLSPVALFRVATPYLYPVLQIGRASCREREEGSVVGG